MITITNKTFGAVTVEESSMGALATVFTVPAGANFMLKTIKAVDLGGAGGEVRFHVGGYCFEAATIEGGASTDLSPTSPYAFEEGSEIKYQNEGGAGIHITLTGILQTVEQ